MKKQPIHIASCSFGKDSIATILLALENNEPLDRVVFAEVMFDIERGISGEIPEHIDWIRKVAVPKLESMGVKVDIVRAKKDYVRLCKRVLTRGEKKGRMYGLQSARFCYANSELKISPIRDYYKKFKQDYIITQYVGIAIDEPVRLARLKGKQVSLLAKYGYTEVMAMEKCKEYNLVSPCYINNWGEGRQGCWFCFYAPLSRYMHIRKNYPEYWQALRDLYYETDSKRFKYNYTLEDIEVKIEQYRKLQEFNSKQLSLFE